MIFTGDLYDNYSRYNDNENIINELKNINAKYKIAIWGNRDYGGGASKVYEDIMNKSGFLLLKNENLYIKIYNKILLFTGLDDTLLRNPIIKDKLENENIDYNILLSHEPDIIDNFKEINYNLILSGHSHVGQLNIPFIKPVTTKLAEKYIKGIYNINNNKILYVNTGIGTTKISIRFGVVPNITLFNIYV